MWKWKIKIDWKHCLVEVGKKDKRDFRVEIWAAPLPCEVMMFPVAAKDIWKYIDLKIRVKK